MAKLPPEKRKRALAAAVCAAAGSALYLLALLSGGLYNADLAFQDLLFQRPSRDKQPVGVAVIGIDGYALEAAGGSWDAGQYARLVEALNSDPDCRPAVIGISEVLTSEEYPDVSGALARALRQARNVVIACSTRYEGRLMVYSARQNQSAYAGVTSSELVEPDPALARAASAVGHTVPLFDADGVARRHLWTLHGGEGDTIPSLPYLLYQRYCRANGLEADFSPDLRQRNSWGIPFSRKPGGFYTYSAGDILLGAYDPGALRGALVLVGPYGTAQTDEFLTAADRRQPMAGVEYLANAAAAMLAGTAWRELEDAKQMAVLVPLCFLLAFYVGMARRLRSGLAAGAAALAACLAAALGLCRAAGYTTHTLWALTAVLMALAAGGICRSLLWAAERRQDTETLQRYLDPQVVRELTRSGAGVDNRPHVAEIAVLFVDIRGFTSLSEKLMPDALVGVLNDYLTLTSRCVKQHGGAVDKFIGDAMMAIWGAPLPCADPAGEACRAARDMVRESRLLAEKTRRRYGCKVEFGVGIHFGPAVVGNIGSPERMDYTAVGDVVNTASRLEAQAAPGEILISRQVADQLVSGEFTLSRAKSMKLRGKTGVVEVFRVQVRVSEQRGGRA